MKPVLQVKGLKKSFDEQPVLNEISFDVKKGEFLVIMGPSGSGKSTLLYTISGMDRADAGEIQLAGHELSVLSEDELSDLRLKLMGFIFQHSYLLKNISIRDNIVLPGFKARLKSRTEVNRDADELMTKTGILEIGHHDIHKVSGGQLQRAAICRALINDPAVLFCDEPTGALNSSATNEVMDILNKIHDEGSTIIMVTHDVKVASRAGRVIYLLDGEIRDELMLAPNESGERRPEDCERLLSEWLDGMGF